MKFGVLDFSYKGFSHFEQEIALYGNYSVNLGDNCQSIAMRTLYEYVGIQKEEIINVDRDEIETYSGTQVCLIMNGVFTRRSFPPSKNIIPIFLGFCAKEDLIVQHLDYFRQHQPIGCRDIVTKLILERCGIAAYVTGCITLTFAKRLSHPPHKKLLVVYGSGSGALPSKIIKHIPADLLDCAEFIYHRLPSFNIPLTDQQRNWAENFEERLLKLYSETATIVLTPLHHVATPCIALGIPVIICRNSVDSRFSFIEERVPIYTPGDFEIVDWNVGPTDFSDVRDYFISCVKSEIERISASSMGLAPSSFSLR